MEFGIPWSILSRMISQEEYEDYQYLYCMEGYGPQGDDIRTAQICQMISASTGRVTTLDEHMYFKMLRESQIENSRDHKITHIYNALQKLRPTKR